MREDRGMPLRPHVDHEECVSSGACVLEAPEAFAYQDGPEQLAVVQPGAADLSDDELRSVAALCPVQAIHLYDDDGTEVPVEG
jgi:ferredoxin